ncbi:hypothetical protein GCM10017687_53830 [Streptomyces echinatus]
MGDHGAHGEDEERDGHPGLDDHERHVHLRGQQGVEHGEQDVFERGGPAHQEAHGRPERLAGVGVHGSGGGDAAGHPRVAERGEYHCDEDGQAERGLPCGHGTLLRPA